MTRGRKPNSTPFTKAQSDLMGDNYELATRQTMYYMNRNSWCSFDDAYDVAIQSLEYAARTFKEEKGATFESYYIGVAKMRYQKFYALRIQDLGRGVKYATSLNNEMYETGEEFESIFGERDQYEVENLAVFEVMKERLSEKEFNLVYERYILGAEIRDISAKYGYTNWRSSSYVISKALAKVRDVLERSNITLNELLA